MFATTEKDPNIDAINAHMAAQPAIQLLAKKVKNWCHYLLENIKDRQLLEPTTRKTVIDRISLIANTIETQPLAFVTGLNMLGAQFFDQKTRKFDFEKLIAMLPAFRKLAANIPGSDPDLLALKLEDLPEDVLDKTKAYLNCFCDFIIPK